MIPDLDLFCRAVVIAMSLPSDLRDHPPTVTTEGERRADNARLAKLAFALARAQREFEAGIAAAQVKYGPDVRVARIRIAE